MCTCNENHRRIMCCTAYVDTESPPSGNAIIVVFCRPNDMKLDGEQIEARHENKLRSPRTIVIDCSIRVR